MRIVAVIPARLASTRLPRKPLRELAGRPMIAWVYEAVRNSGVLPESDVIIATDSNEIMAVCKKNGWNSRLTSDQHRSGTERVNEVAQSEPAEVYLNIQGDEPLTRAEHIRALVDLMRDPKVQVGTLMTPAVNGQDVYSPSAVKVVTNQFGDALYFSRSTIPMDRDGMGGTYFKHLGFYGYQAATLRQFCSWEETQLEKTERLEQLRFLYHGVPIRVAETPFDTVGVDTEEDVKRVEAILKSR